MTTFYYMSGEEVREGDIVVYHGEQGVVESVFSKGTEEARDFSCFETGGILLKVESFGLVLDPWPSESEDLEFRGRADAHR